MLRARGKGRRHSSAEGASTGVLGLCLGGYVHATAVRLSLSLSLAPTYSLSLSLTLSLCMDTSPRVWTRLYGYVDGRTRDLCSPLPAVYLYVHLCLLSSLSLSLSLSLALVAHRCVRYRCALFRSPHVCAHRDLHARR